MCLLTGLSSTPPPTAQTCDDEEKAGVIYAASSANVKLLSLKKNPNFKQIITKLQRNYSFRNDDITTYTFVSGRLMIIMDVIIIMTMQLTCVSHFIKDNVVKI